MHVMAHDILLFTAFKPKKATQKWKYVVFTAYKSETYTKTILSPNLKSDSI
jgi:hypothetical protein